MVLINYIHQIISALHSLSYIIRSSLIDTVWVSANIEVKASSICPHAFSVGNNRAIIVDVSYSSMISSLLVPIHLPSMHQLILSNLLAAKSYLEWVNKGVSKYKIKLKLKWLIDNWEDIEPDIR